MLSFVGGIVVHLDDAAALLFSRQRVCHNGMRPDVNAFGRHSEGMWADDGSLAVGENLRW